MIQPTASPGEYARIGIGFRCMEKGVDYIRRLSPKQCFVLVREMGPKCTLNHNVRR